MSVIPLGREDAPSDGVFNRMDENGVNVMEWSLLGDKKYGNCPYHHRSSFGNGNG